MQEQPQFRARRRISLLAMGLALIAFSALVTLGPPASAQSGPWFGASVPKGMSDPAKPVLNFNNAIKPLPISGAGNSAGDSMLSGEMLAADLHKIIGFSFESRAAGDLMWGRISGMPAMHRTVEWAVDELKKAGLKDAKVDDFTCDLWWPAACEVRVLGNPAFGAGSPDVVLGSAFFQRSTTGKGSLTAPLVFVGHGSAADLAGKDIRGKVAVLHVRPDPSLFSAPERGVPRQLISQGAAAVISVIESPGNMQYCDTRFGGDNAPCFTVGGQDGFFLERVIGEAAKAGKLDELKVSLNYESQQKRGLTSCNGVAIVPGKSKKNVIISAHADGYFQAADDNANGLATLVALARYFGRKTPEHTLVFVVSAGHHSPGNGSSNFIRMHPEILQDTVLVMNIEHVAYSSLSKGSNAQRDNFGNQLAPGVSEGPKKVGVTNMSPFLVDLWRTGTARFGVVTSQVIDSGVPGDLGSYNRLGKPATQMIGSSVFYHSSGDVAELVPVSGMERAARFHAWFIEEVDRAPDSSLDGPRGRNQ